MGGKYSAEWWEKTTGISRETTARHDPAHVELDDLSEAPAARTSAVGVVERKEPW